MSELDHEEGVRYLLGELTEDEASALEDATFDHPERVEVLEALEAELFADYACGALQGPRRAAFEARFLSTPEGRARLADARLFERSFTQGARVIPLRRRVTAALAAIAAVVLAVVGAAIFATRDDVLVVRLSPELRSAGTAVQVDAPGAKRVTLELALDDEPALGPFVVEWARDGTALPALSATRAPGAAALRVDVDGATLSTGRYEVTVRAEGDPVARYVFRVR
ncbi:hypothetical protein L6R52_19480 [Myxococcota bacterium]|nr:hypothetical protein [Myxococcota bacterium]